MVAIDSVESFRAFYDRFERCSASQQQVMNAFTVQVDPDQQVQFYECWQQFEAPETTVEPVQATQSAQEPVKPAGQSFI